MREKAGLTNSSLTESMKLLPSAISRLNVAGISNHDEDEDILNIVRERLKNPARRIRVNIDEL